MDLQIQDKTYTIDNTFLDTFTKESGTDIFTIYVNRPFDIDTLHSLHEISAYTVMADGAANRYYDKFQSRLISQEIIPSAIVGDLDSIRQEVLEYYKEKGVNIAQNPSEDNSDLEKCILHLDEKIQQDQQLKENKRYKIVIAGGLGGRLDHSLNNIFLIHKYSLKYAEENIDVSLLLMDNNSVGTCILPGKTKYIKSRGFEINKGCGFFPFLGEVKLLRTKGLRWDIGEDSPSLAFDKFISSSNEMVEETIEFETEKTIFWTTTNILHDKGQE